MRTIYTIGHSTRTLEKFIETLRSFDIEAVADIRRFPGSRKYPWFNVEPLAEGLRAAGIAYVPLEALGGRRKVAAGSKNTRWRNAAFQGYADYMETPAFKAGVEELEALAAEKRTAYLCSEAVWWRCHRSMVSDYLKARGWEVLHIMAPGKAQEHPYTAPAVVHDGTVSYAEASAGTS